MQRDVPANAAGNVRGFPLFRLLAYAAVLGLAAAFVAANRTELPAAARAARDASPEWLALALLLALLNLVNVAAFYRAAFRAVGLPGALRELYRPAWAGLFLNLVVVNSGGFAGLAVFLREADRRGLPRSRVVTGYVLVAQLGHLVFALVLVLALTVAWADGQVTRAELLASAVFGFYTVASVATLVAAARSRAAVVWLHELPWRARAFAARLVRRSTPGRPPDDEAAQLFEALNLMLRRPVAILPAAFHAVLVEVIGVATVWFVLLAFHQDTGVGTPLIAYAMGVVFSVVGFLPAGLGFAEAGIGIALAGAGVAGAVAALAVVTFRACEVWIPFTVGAWAMHAFERQGHPR